MSNTKNARVLVFYSNPENTSRLRLDIEHRAIDVVLQRLNLDASVVTRLHATSIDDLIYALKETNYEIIQFSGHGSSEAIYLEDSQHKGSQEISANHMASILKGANQNLKAVIFLSCYSTDVIDELVKVAPFIITVTGVADDEAAIKFMGQFYDSFFREGSVEKAFNVARTYLEILGKDEFLQSVLSRRAMIRGEDRVFFQVFPSGSEDSILIDLTDVEKDIQALNIPRDNFLSLLSRKIRIHRWIFNSPRERVVLSIGPYFGIFSWQNSSDAVVCNKLLRIKPEVDEETCSIWASLIVAYNDLYVDPYRTTSQPSNPSIDLWLKKAIKGYERTYKSFFAEEEKSKYIRAKVPDQFKVTKALFEANLNMCETKFYQEDYSNTVMYLEAILSSIHDLIDGLTSGLTQ